MNRWKEGCHNGSALIREIVAKAYRGGTSILRQRLQEWRRIMPETARGRNIVIPSARSVCAWLLGLEYRSAVEVESRQEFIDLLCKLNPQIAESRRLAQQLIAMVRKELPAQLDAWISQACHSGIQELRRFAEGLGHDHAAVALMLGFADSIHTTLHNDEFAISVWIVTEADRSTTTLLLPGEY